jgi:hypothetical protein
MGCAPVRDTEAQSLDPTLSQAPNHIHVGIRRPRPHDISTGRLVLSWQSGGLGIKRLHDNAVRTDRNGRAPRIIRIGITALRGARQPSFSLAWSGERIRCLNR